MSKPEMVATLVKSKMGMRRRKEKLKKAQVPQMGAHKQMRMIKKRILSSQ